MRTDKPTDGAKFAGVGLILLGTLFLSFGLSYFASYVAYDWPATPVRCVASSVLGVGVGLLGYRLATGTWSGSTQIPHRAAALAGIFFLAITCRLYLKTSGPSTTQTGWLLSGFSLVAVATWYIRARGRRRSRAYEA